MKIRIDKREVWKSVVGYEGLYEVSNAGRVRSLPRLAECGGKFRRTTAKIIGSTDTRGYRRVGLGNGLGIRTSRKIHCLVLEAFVGPCPASMQCCHGNGIESDNRLENLRWDTPKANKYDSVTHGTIARGETQWKAKLTTDEVLEIREMYSTGEYSTTELGNLFGVSFSCISAVVRRYTWKHV